MSQLRITGLDTIPIKVSDRTTWLVIRLTTNDRYTGLGECSLGSAMSLSELATFFDMVHDTSPFDINAFRHAGWSKACAGGLLSATAYSAIEQAMWDVLGKVKDAPVHALLGGINDRSIPVYANINRRTTHRTPSGFADNAKLACAAGFTSLKAAPFDGLPLASAGQQNREWAIDLGIEAMKEMRSTVGSSVSLKVDCHSYFDYDEAIDVAERLVVVDLDWYEEPVAISDLETTKRIREHIPQRLAGGELSCGVEGFAGLCEQQAVDVVMPDVMHCGGLIEFLRIAQIAKANGLTVSPHNACGPVATAATIQVAACSENIESLELQWGEVSWRSELVEPHEEFADGVALVTETPGLGIHLNEALVEEHRVR